MRITLALIFFCFIAGSLSAQKTTLQGNAFSYKGKQLEVHEYTDLFTFSSNKIDSIILPTDGTFRLSIDIEKTGLYFVKVGRVYGHVFMIPGDEYTIVLPEPIEMDRFTPAKNVFVQPEIFEANSRLNYQITKLEQKINEFFIDNTQEDFRLRSGSNIKTLADSFKIVLKTEFASVENQYFQQYLQYKLAEFDIVTRHSKAHVYKEYFENKPVDFEQLTYANAFRLLYDDFLKPKTIKPYAAEAELAILAADIDQLRSLLNTDPLLSNVVAVDLVIATELHDLGMSKVYDHTTAIVCLDSLGSKTNSAEIIELIKNSKAKMLNLAPGTRAPNFVFADVVGNLYRLSEYEGGFIYIQFFKKFDSETLRQMSLMKVLRDGYGSDIAMFSFSTEESLKTLREIPKKHDFDWFFGKIGHPDKVIEDYDLRALPQYFFIDESLNIIQYPSPPPGSRIERQFAKIWNEKHPNKAFPFKLQPPAIDSTMGAQFNQEK